MRSRLDRRSFVKQSALATTAWCATSAVNSALAARSASETIIVGVMGVNGRGAGLAKAFAAQPGCEVGWICDVDSLAAGRAAEGLSSSRRPEIVGDFRRVL